MYHPTRGGVRGGRDQFSWDQVKTDKDRECYLGHSLKAPVGRWQQGKDLTWYAKDSDQTGQTKSNDEFLEAKELEEQALMAALGYKVIKKEPKTTAQLSEASSKSPKSAHEFRPSTKFIKFDDKKALDTMLLKLIKKHGLNGLIEALDGSIHEKRKKKRSKKEKNL